MTREEAINFLQQIYPNGGHCWLDEQRIEAINMAIEALREEPKPKFKVGDRVRLIKLDSNIDCKIGDILTVSTPELFQLTADCWELVEEPVSEELEVAAKLYATKKYHKKTRSSLPQRCIGCYAPLTDAFKAGATWKEEQFEKNRLAACDRQTEKEADIERDFVMSIIEKEHRQPTFDDAIKYGMTLQKEEVIEKACCWLEENAKCFVALADDEHPAIGDTKATYGTKSLLYYFKQAIEEEKWK